MKNDQFKCFVCGGIHHIEGATSPEAKDDFDSCFDVVATGNPDDVKGTACEGCFSEHTSAWMNKKFGVIFADDVNVWEDNEIPHNLSDEDYENEDSLLAERKNKTA